MKAYAFQGALICEACAKIHRHSLDLHHITSPYPLCRHGISVVRCEDSDCYPQGPMENGGGPSDTPNRCDFCNVFLQNPLTEEGEQYLLSCGDIRQEYRERYAYLFVEAHEPEIYQFSKEWAIHSAQESTAWSPSAAATVYQRHDGTFNWTLSLLPYRAVKIANVRGGKVTWRLKEEE